MTGIRSLTRFGLFAALLVPGVVASLVCLVPARAQEPARGKKYALLVAVDRYERGSLLPGLPFPGRDIEGLAKLFVEAGYAKDDVIVMTRERGLEAFDLMPTAEHIRNQLGLLLDQLNPGDSVIVGLAGHGVMMLAPPHEDPKGEPRLRSFFCPMDANLVRKNVEKFVSYDELYASLDASKATTKLLLVDACRNELLANPQGRPGGIAMPPPPPPPASVAALFSCSEKEVSWEDAELDGGHGVFFHYVIEGLKGAADIDGSRNVSLLELTEYTQKAVSAFVRRKHSTSQLPRLRGDIGPVSLIDVNSGLAQSKTITNTIGMTLTLIKAGEFMMGSDATDPGALDNEYVATSAGRKEKHRVRITRPFHLGVTEVTRGQFRRFVDDAGYQTDAEKDGKGGYGWNDETNKFEQNPKYTWQNAGFEQTDEHPVVNVSWNDAVAFAQWLSRKEGKTYRLPTEAEWEYACRAGTTTHFSSGDDAERLGVAGNAADGTAKEKYPEWTWAIAARDGYVYTAPVGRFHGNAFGLHDMHGNVWEWCSDGYSADYYKQSSMDDPPAPREPRAGWAAAAAGTTGPASAGRRTAAGARRRPGTTTWGFAWPWFSLAAELKRV